MSKITIDLNKSLSANSFDKGERIHYKAFDKVLHLIEAQMASCKSYNPLEEENGGDNGFHRCYNAISVFGERGVGKTSFLMSLRKYLKEEKNEGGDMKCGNIVLLPMLDPTLIEEKGHIFLLIVSLLDAEVMKHLGSGDYKGDCVKDEHRWNVAKSLLAKGLPSLKLDGLTYHEPQWNEDEYVMNRGLESVNAAFYLERNFHKLVRLALELLDKKVFVLMFDDIDVDFKRGWDLLETVRKYLTTPQMILVISGNMKLFSKNVRKQQWHNLGKELLINEKDEKGAHDYYNQLVNEIEGQYLLKILNSENRIFLYDVGRNIQMNGDEYHVVYGENDEYLLDAAYGRVLQRYGIYGHSVTNVFIDFLKSTSMRTQVHFLYNAELLERNDDTFNLMSAISALSSRIYAQNVNVEMAANKELYCSALLHYLVDNRLVEDAYQLLPKFDDADVNSVVTGFSILFALLSNDSTNLVFDYWVKVCMLRNCMRYLEYRTEVSKGDANFKYVEDFCQETGVFQKRDLRSIVGNTMAATLAINSKQELDASIPLMGFGGKAKENKLRINNRIDIVLDTHDVTQVLGYLPLVCLLHSHKNERELYYSFNALIAIIGGLLKSNDVYQYLKTACQPVSYQIKSSDISSGNAENTSEIDLAFDEDSLETVANAVESWKGLYNSDYSYAPYLYGRIMTRFFFAQSNIQESNKDMGLGERFRLLAMAFVNASIIEELLVRGNDTKGLNVNNVASSSKVLVDNINFLLGKGQKELIPFTSWIMICPLLVPFMDITEDKTLFDFTLGLIDKHNGQENGNDDVLTLRDFVQTHVMISRLNQIGIRPSARNLVEFTFGDKTIAETINMINQNGINVELIMNENMKDDAINALSQIFKSVTASKLTRFRKKCVVSPETGELILKGKE